LENLRNTIHCEDYKFVAGVDEAGRGPLYGDVFAAAVILPPNLMPNGITDSKKLSEKKRETLYTYIIENCVAYGIGRATSKEIDEVNIRNATFLAMKRAIYGLDIDISRVHFLIDGNAFDGLDISYETVVGGDAKNLSISAASIIAKVSRDRYMREVDKLYPNYGFARHKGYGTREHYDAIRQFGILNEHRKSFNLGSKIA